MKRINQSRHLRTKAAVIVGAAALGAFVCYYAYNHKHSRVSQTKSSHGSHNSDMAASNIESPYSNSTSIIAPEYNKVEAAAKTSKKDSINIENGFDLFVDESIREIAEESDREMFLMRVAELDKRSVSRFEFPLEELESASTTRLIKHFLSSPATTLFFLHGDMGLGVQRALNSSLTLQEISRRKDFAEAIIESYLEDSFDADLIDPNDVLSPGEREGHMKRLETQSRGPIPQDITPRSLSIGKISSIVYFRNQMLMHPTFFTLLEGYEKDVLFVLAENHRRILSARKEYYEQRGQYCYSTPLKSGRELALMLAKRIDTDLYYKLYGIENIEELVNVLLESLN